MMACGSARPAPSAPTPEVRAAPQVQLTVIPAESDMFPRAAQAVSASLAAAKIDGMATQVSKVSLEVVQLSVECVESSDACYQAVGRSMSANQLLFARIDRGATRRKLKVTVTLYDVEAGSAKRSAEKLFASEDQAIAGASALVEEATR